MSCFTLDDQTTLDTTHAEPVGVVRRLDRALIDEVQRAPQLMLAIKRCADPDMRPVRFLLTWPIPWRVAWRSSSSYRYGKVNCAIDPAMSSHG